MNLCVQIATGKIRRGMPEPRPLQAKKRRTGVRLLGRHRERWSVFACGEPRVVRHSAGWACSTAALFSDALIEIRIGRTTNSAIATTMKFITAATANTAYQLPV